MYYEYCKNNPDAASRFIEKLQCDAIALREIGDRMAEFVRAFDSRKGDELLEEWKKLKETSE